MFALSVLWVYSVLIVLCDLPFCGGRRLQFTVANLLNISCGFCVRVCFLVYCWLCGLACLFLFNCKFGLCVLVCGCCCSLGLWCCC